MVFVLQVEPAAQKLRQRRPLIKRGRLHMATDDRSGGKNVAVRGQAHLMPSGEDLADYMAVHVRQAPVDAVVPEGQALVVDTQEVEDSGVQVVAVGLAPGGLVAEFVALAVGAAALDPG